MSANATPKPASYVVDVDLTVSGLAGSVTRVARVTLPGLVPAQSSTEFSRKVLTVPPGIPRDPGPGQYYASPALAALLRSTPADQLAGRYPGRLAGTIGDAALPSPNSLVIIVGRTPAQLAGTPNSVQVMSIATEVPAGVDLLNPEGLNYIPPNAPGVKNAIDFILSVVALAILAPVLIFIATATRLSAARREERFAAMRLAGATRRQVSLIAATESAVAGIGGVAAGFGLFFLLRIPVARIPLTGQPFFPAELSLSLPDILA